MMLELMIFGSMDGHDGDVYRSSWDGMRRSTLGEEAAWCHQSTTQHRPIPPNRSAEHQRERPGVSET